MRLILQLQIPADARFLPKTRRAVAGYLEETGAPTDAADDVVLALDEACANVIRHAFPAGFGTGTIFLHAAIDEQGVDVQVEDDGVGFDPFHVDLRGASLEATSGRGLQLIRQLMTSVELESPTESGTGTRLRMHKDLGK